MGAHEQTGIAACFSLDEYDSDVIKKHERTRRDKEDDRTRHIIELRAQTGVVFLTYRAVPTIDELAREVTAGAPLYDFTAADGVRHTIWRAGAAQTSALVDAVHSRSGALHRRRPPSRGKRGARARGAARSPGAPGDEADASTFIAVAFPDNQVADPALQPNRQGSRRPRRRSSFSSDIRKRVPVTPGVRHAEPARAKSRCIWPAAGTRIDIGNAKPSDDSRASALDVARLQHSVLEPVLGIGDVRTDKRIDFVGGARGTKALEEAVDSGRAAVAFSMYPVTVDDLMAISDAGGIMPPKSTWFEPKLRDGLLIHLI